MFSLHKCWVDQGLREACSCSYGAEARTSPALEPDQMALERELCCMGLTEASLLSLQAPTMSMALLELGLWRVESLLSEMSLRSSLAMVLRPLPAGPWRPPLSVSLPWWELMTHPCRGFPICVLRERCSTH